MSDPLVKRHAYGTRPRSVSRSSIVDIEKEEEPVPRRTLTNRLSAIRSKERQRAYVTGLEQRVKELNSQLTAYHASLHAHALESLDLGDATLPLRFQSAIGTAAAVTLWINACRLAARTDCSIFRDYTLAEAKQITSHINSTYCST
jgi:hypothetical protein